MPKIRLIGDVSINGKLSSAGDVIEMEALVAAVLVKDKKAIYWGEPAEITESKIEPLRIDPGNDLRQALDVQFRASVKRTQDGINARLEKLPDSFQLSIWERISILTTHITQAGSRGLKILDLIIKILGIFMANNEQAVPYAKTIGTIIAVVGALLGFFGIDLPAEVQAGIVSVGLFIVGLFMKKPEKK